MSKPGEKAGQYNIYQKDELLTNTSIEDILKLSKIKNDYVTAAMIYEKLSDEQKSNIQDETYLTFIKFQRIYPELKLETIASLCANKIDINLALNYIEDNKDNIVYLQNSLNPNYILEQEDLKKETLEQNSAKFKPEFYTDLLEKPKFQVDIIEPSQFQEEQLPAEVKRENFPLKDKKPSNKRLILPLLGIFLGLASLAIGIALFFTLPFIAPAIGFMAIGAAGIMIGSGFLIKESICPSQVIGQEKFSEYQQLSLLTAEVLKNKTLENQVDILL